MPLPVGGLVCFNDTQKTQIERWFQFKVDFSGCIKECHVRLSEIEDSNCLLTLSTFCC